MDGWGEGIRVSRVVFLDSADTTEFHRVVFLVEVRVRPVQLFDNGFVMLVDSAFREGSGDELGARISGREGVCGVVSAMARVTFVVVVLVYRGVVVLPYDANRVWPRAGAKDDLYLYHRYACKRDRSGGRFLRGTMFLLGFMVLFRSFRDRRWEEASEPDFVGGVPDSCSYVRA